MFAESLGSTFLAANRRHRQLLDPPGHARRRSRPTGRSGAFLGAGGFSAATAARGAPRTHPTTVCLERSRARRGPLLTPGRRRGWLLHFNGAKQSKTASRASSAPRPGSWKVSGCTTRSHNHYLHRRWVTRLNRHSSRQADERFRGRKGQGPPRRGPSACARSRSRRPGRQDPEHPGLSCVRTAAERSAVDAGRA
jgi:hypothetical protein